MRIKRGKKYHKYVNFFKVVYKFHPPHKILCDGNFIFKVASEAIDIKKLLHSILQDQPLLVMTKCIMRELENLDKSLPGLASTLQMAKNTIKLSC